MEQPENISGTAGQSAYREAQCRHAQLQQARASRPRLANFRLGPNSEQKRLAREEKSWTTGAQGEERLAKTLAKRCPDVALLHDRRMPRSRANVDHIAVAASGVYVIDAKRYRGKIEVRSPLFGEAKLLIAGRDRTKLVVGLEKQVAVVRRELAPILPEVAVYGCLCFLAPEGMFSDIGLPIIRTLKLKGIPLYYPRRLAKRLNQSGPLTPEQMRHTCAELALLLPPA